jgi:NAD(P)-dependent dehydrogenase (short-subunit alcohol dehydrogenase family)
VQAAFAAAEEQLGEVTALANVAGVGRFSPFTELTEEQWDHTFAVNTRGTFLTGKEFVRRRAGCPGAVVNIASIGARLGMEMLADYGPSKAAVIELTHVVARVGAPTRLRANAVMPGLIWTDMWRSTSEWLIANDPAHADATPEQLFAGFVGQMVPMGAPRPPPTSQRRCLPTLRAGRQHYGTDRGHGRRRGHDLTQHGRVGHPHRVQASPARLLQWSPACIHCWMLPCDPSCLAKALLSWENVAAKVALTDMGPAAPRRNSAAVRPDTRAFDVEHVSRGAFTFGHAPPGEVLERAGIVPSRKRKK